MLVAAMQNATAATFASNPTAATPISNAPFTARAARCSRRHASTAMPIADDDQHRAVHERPPPQTPPAHEGPE